MSDRLPKPYPMFNLENDMARNGYQNGGAANFDMFDHWMEHPTGDAGSSGRLPDLPSEYPISTPNVDRHIVPPSMSHNTLAQLREVLPPPSDSVLHSSQSGLLWPTDGATAFLIPPAAYPSAPPLPAYPRFATPRTSSLCPPASAPYAPPPTAHEPQRQSPVFVQPQSSQHGNAFSFSPQSVPSLLRSSSATSSSQASGGQSDTVYSQPSPWLSAARGQEHQSQVAAAGPLAARARVEATTQPPPPEVRATAPPRAETPPFPPLRHRLTRAEAALEAKTGVRVISGPLWWQQQEGGCYPPAFAGAGPGGHSYTAPSARDSQPVAGPSRLPHVGSTARASPYPTDSGKSKKGKSKAPPRPIAQDEGFVCEIPDPRCNGAHVRKTKAWAEDHLKVCHGIDLHAMQRSGETFYCPWPGCGTAKELTRYKGSCKAKNGAKHFFDHATHHALTVCIPLEGP